MANPSFEGTDEAMITDIIAEFGVESNPEPAIGNSDNPEPKDKPSSPKFRP